MRFGGRKLLAVLAGGVVLVGGGVTTLAAWEDQSFSQTPLTLTRFNLQQTLDGVNWIEADTSGSASQLALLVAGLSTTPLLPNGAATAWVGLRVDPGSLGGTVTMTGADVGADTALLAPHVSYKAVSGVSRSDCSSLAIPAAGAPGTAVLAADDSRLGTATGASFHLDKGTGTDAGAAVGVCFKLSLENGLPRSFNGATLSPVWKFSAVSDAS